jgi:hypothetical protein
MVGRLRMSCLVECFRSGVREEDLQDVDRRITDSVAALPDVDDLRYLGSILVLDDEVVLCLFDGPLATVRRVVEHAGVPYERILRTTRTMG